MIVLGSSRRWWQKTVQATNIHVSTQIFEYSNTQLFEYYLIIPTNIRINTIFSTSPFEKYTRICKNTQLIEKILNHSKRTTDVSLSLDLPDVLLFALTMVSVSLWRTTTSSAGLSWNCNNFCWAYKLQELSTKHVWHQFVVCLTHRNS